MKAYVENLRLKQVETRLEPWRQIGPGAPPASGWIKAIREAVGMPPASLAQRMGIERTTVLRMENSEAEQTISLATLQRAAAALDCDLVYALVPRKPLAEVIDAQARRIVGEQLARVSATMALEAQQTSPDALRTLEQQMTADLLSGPRKALWK